MAAPGPMELFLILGLIGGVAILVVVAIAIFAASRKGSNAPRGDSPNLFPCPDCGRLISVRASVCPHCGGPVEAKKL